MNIDKMAFILKKKLFLGRFISTFLIMKRISGFMKDNLKVLINDDLSRVCDMVYICFSYHSEIFICKVNKF